MKGHKAVATFGKTGLQSPPKSFSNGPTRTPKPSGAPKGGTPHKSFGHSGGRSRPQGGGPERL